MKRNKRKKLKTHDSAKEHRKMDEVEYAKSITLLNYTLLSAIQLICRKLNIDMPKE